MPFTTSEALVVFKAEADNWGLLEKGYRFETDNSTRRNGWCTVPTRVLGLSRQSIQHTTKEEVVNTMRHEIAHALHFEWCVDNNINYLERVPQFRRGKLVYVRKIKPHGREWKRFAIMTGAKAKATSKQTANNTAVGNWRVVIVKNGRVEDTQSNCQRFLKSMPMRYPTGRKDAVGHLYLVRGRDWSQATSGERCVNTLKFYQKPNVPTNFDNLTLSS